MGRRGKKKRKGGGGGRPAKGFRPGKEPEFLKKQRARAQVGEDASWAQKQTVEAVAGKSPDEVRAMVRGWTKGLLVAALALVVLGGLLYLWTPVAGLIVHALAVVALVLWYRVRKHGDRLVETAEAFEKRGGR